MSAIVGIDLGTSNSVVAWEDELGSVRVLPDRAGTRIHPSVVSFVEGKVVGGVVVGAEAKARKITDPANTIYSFKRLMGQSTSSLAVRQARTRVPYTILDGPDDTPLIQTCAGAFSPVELSAILLDHLREVSSEAIGRPVAHAVIAVPANFNDAQRSATASAGKIAGLDVLRVINEPTAAALAYGNTKRLHEIIAVYDFGGGTFDTTIMKLENQVYTVLGTAGDTFLGGDDFDERLVERMLAKVIVDHRVDLREDMVAMMRLRSIAEQLKIELSRQARAVVRVPEIARYRNTPVSLAFEITRDEFVSLVQDLVERTLSVTRDALSVAQIKIDRVSDVILVGGTTQIPYVRERVAAFFHKAARTDVSPEDAVAIGAALQAASLEQAMMRAPSAPVRVPFQLPEPTAPPPPFADPSVDTGFFFAEEPARVAPQPAPRLPTESLPIIDLDAIADEDEDSALDWALAQETAGVDYLGAALVAPRPVAPPPRPVVIDVTPSSFGITTIGGYCEMLIPRNTSLPFTIKKRFVTVRDAQDSVRIVVYQGETKRVETNTVLGEVLLTEIVPRPRGGVEIEVSFVLDSSGMLQVSAHDAVTGQLQHVDLDLVGRMGEDEVATARDRVRELRR